MKTDKTILVARSPFISLRKDYPNTSENTRIFINTYFGKTTEERFWEKVKKTDGCWEWLGTKSKDRGYISVAGKMISAPRFSYWLHKGEILEGLCVCHTCDNPRCVNPEHLWLGTHADNMKDMRLKGRVKQERNGRAKHSKAEVEEIKKLYATGKYTQRKLGELFGVSHTNVYAICKGIIWK